MFTRLTQSLMVLLMAVPMCWCCMAKALPSPAAKTDCLSCHKFLLPEDMPQDKPAPDSDCPCCQGTLERNISPDIAAAPRLILVDLQAWVWLAVEEDLPPLKFVQADYLQTARNHGPPRLATPLYHLHCSLLT